MNLVEEDGSASNILQLNSGLDEQGVSMESSDPLKTEQQMQKFPEG